MSLQQVAQELLDDAKAAFIRLEDFLHIHHAALAPGVAGVASTTAPVAVAEPVVVPVVEDSNRQLLLDAASSKDSTVLAACLNSGNADALARAVINLTSPASDANARLGLLVDGMSMEKYATVEFFNSLNQVAKDAIVAALKSNPGDPSQLLARLGANPHLRYDGGNNFTTL